MSLATDHRFFKVSAYCNAEWAASKGSVVSGRVGVWALRRMGVTAYRRIDVSTYGRCRRYHRQRPHAHTPLRLTRRLAPPLATMGIRCDSEKCPCWVRFLF